MLRVIKYHLMMAILEKVPFLLLAAGSSVVTFWVQRKGGSVSTSLSFGRAGGECAGVVSEICGEACSGRSIYRCCIRIRGRGRWDW